RKDPAPAEPHFVAAAGRQVEVVCFLPAADLEAIAGRRLRIRLERIADIVAGAEAVVDGPEIEAGEIDRVESERVDAPDRLEQREVGPRALAELVGVVMNEPARVELPGELGLPEKNPLPSENGRRAIGRRFRKTLDG